MMRLPLPSWLALLMLLSAEACRRDAGAQAAAMEPCPWWGCSGDNVCIQETNTCVKPCVRDDECPDGFACKGHFSDITTFSGQGGGFCRKASIPPGDPCTAFGPACSGEAVCVDGICRPRCDQDDDCPPGWKCHLTVLGAQGLSEAFSYRVCVKTGLPEGAACTVSGDPACDQGLVCMFEVCRRMCTVNSDCPQGQTCSGHGYNGWRGRIRMSRSRTPDFLFCTF